MLDHHLQQARKLSGECQLPSLQPVRSDFADTVRGQDSAKEDQSRTDAISGNIKHICNCCCNASHEIVMQEEGTSHVSCLWHHRWEVFWRLMKSWNPLKFPHLFRWNSTYFSLLNQHFGPLNLYVIIWHGILWDNNTFIDISPVNTLTIDIPWFLSWLIVVYSGY